MSERPKTLLEQRTLELHTSNSWRRFHFQHGGPACEPITQHDGHPDLHFPGGFDGPVAKRFLATWNACVGVPLGVLEQIASGVALDSLAVYRRQAGEIRELRDTLARLYDAVQRGDFDHVGIEKSAEALATRLALVKRGEVFDEFGRRRGAEDKHGNVTA